MRLRVIEASRGNRLGLEERQHRVQIVERAIHARVSQMSDSAPQVPGAYLFLYRGPIVQYARVARTGVAESAGLASAGGYPIYAGSAALLDERFGRHRRKLRDVSNLEPDDFEVVWLETEGLPAALYAEAVLIEEFAPVWNQPALSGFGSKAQGTLRAQGQRTPPWRVLHPAKGGRPDREQAAGLWKRVANHIEATVPPWW